MNREPFGCHIRYFLSLAKKIFTAPREAFQEIIANDKTRFILVGGAATLSYFALGLLFVNFLRFPTLAGNALAYLLSFIISYLGQCLWTFQAKGSHLRMLPRFALTQALGLGLNSIIIIICMHIGIIYLISMLIAALIVPVFVYIISKHWVFKKQESKDA